MITGFNTDIERDGVVYHVQTEDKGLDSPLILSLVYSGGEILAAKRTPYEDLIAEGFTDEALAERLKRQHRLICAAINAGRIEELKKMSSRRAEDSKAGTPARSEQASVEPKAPTKQPVQVDDEFIIETSSARHEEVVRTPAPPPVMVEQPSSEPEVTPATVHEEFVIETSAARTINTDWKSTVEKVFEESPTPSPEIPSLPLAAEPPSRMPAQTKASSADAAYTVYDSRRPSRPKKKAKNEEELALTILDDDEFRAGENVTIRMLLQQHVGEVEKPLGRVQLSIKVLGATFRPQIYAVKTQKDGVAVVSVDLPHFSSGRAAVVIRAETQGKSVELRRVIHPAG